MENITFIILHSYLSITNDFLLSNNHPKLFFILGCQRSGTTLLRLILESHSKIACVDEHRAYSILSDSNSLEKELESNKTKFWIGFKTPRITEQMLEPLLADVGINFRAINDYKRKKIIFLTRNVLDTIVSMKNLDQDGITWLDRWVDRSIEFWKKTNPEFNKLFIKDLQFLEKSNNKNLVAAAIYWKFKNISYFKYEKNNFPIIKIKYENLVTRSRETINDVLNFLNLEWEDAVLSHEKILHAETDQDGITVGNTNTKSPITSSSMGKYKRFLDNEQISEILHVTKDLMTTLDYTV